MWSTIGPSDIHHVHVIHLDLNNLRHFQVVRKQLMKVVWRTLNFVLRRWLAMMAEFARGKGWDLNFLWCLSKGFIGCFENNREHSPFREISRLFEKHCWKHWFRYFMRCFIWVLIFLVGFSIRVTSSNNFIRNLTGFIFSPHAPFTCFSVKRRQFHC